ncbi:hypothetical protein ACE6H2_026201 [Prunus campanulata]
MRKARKLRDLRNFMFFDSRLGFPIEFRSCHCMCYVGYLMLYVEHSVSML